jgi:hypothetical protein
MDPRRARRWLARWQGLHGMIGELFVLMEFVQLQIREKIL